MSPLIPLFQQQCVQEMFERVLYIWAIRHPASGYVQGVNDLVTPYFIVFLQEVLPTGETAGGEIRWCVCWCLRLVGIKRSVTIPKVCKHVCAVNMFFYSNVVLNIHRCAQSD